MDFGEGDQGAASVQCDPVHRRVSTILAVCSRRKVKCFASLAACCRELVFLEKGYHLGDFGLGDIAEFSKLFESQTLRLQKAHAGIHPYSADVLGKADLSTVNL